MHISKRPQILQLDGVEYDVSNLSLRHNFAHVRLYPRLSSVSDHDDDCMQPVRCTNDLHRQDCQVHGHSDSTAKLQGAKSTAATHEFPHKPQQPETLQPPTIKPTFIQVTPDLRLPLHGSQDTILALKGGGKQRQQQVARHECWSCGVTLGCISTASFIICPFCRCVMPAADAGSSCNGTAAANAEE